MKQEEFDVLDKRSVRRIQSRPCKRCNRTLTSPESVRIGYGKKCLKKVRAVITQHLF